MVALLQREVIYLWYYFSVQFRQIAPYWLLGMVVGSLVSVLLKNHIHRLMVSLQTKPMGTWGILPASALGMLSPLCMYGTIPIVASFARAGMREDWIAAFMMSSILLNPQLLLYTLALGGELALLRLVVCFLGGCVAGLLVKQFFRRNSFYSFTAFNLPGNHDTDPHILKRLRLNLWRNVKITLPYLLLGVGLTALYQRYVPTELVAGLFGANRGLGTLMAAALGVPLYICGGGTIPLLSSWLIEGMSWGSAIAFMVAGPATKLTNLGAVKIALGGRNFIVYVLFSILFATVSGLVINVII